MGADFVVERQQYLEDDGGSFYGIPTAKSYDTGLFIDGILPWTDQLVFKAGGRIDWVGVDSAGIAVDEQTGQPVPGPGSFQSFTLGAGYLIGEYELSDELTAMLGFGCAQRAPTPTDLFASWPYLSILQIGPFFFPSGSPGLAEETTKQIDVGLTADFAEFHGGVRGYYAWVDDFITYDLLDVSMNQDATVASLMFPST